MQTKSIEQNRVLQFIYDNNPFDESGKMKKKKNLKL